MRSALTFTGALSEMEDALKVARKTVATNGRAAERGFG
jgi:hypothetical protein